MKYIFIIIFISMNIIYLNAQDKEPDKMIFVIDGTGDPLDTTFAKFKYNDFWIGWFWGGHTKIGEGMYMNGNHNAVNHIVFEYDVFCFLLYQIALS